MKTQGIPIFIYHSIRNDMDGQPAGRNVSVSLSSFKEQMAWLHQEGFTTVTEMDIATLLLEKKAIPAKKAMITFDDGYYSNYKYAFPILAEYGFTATLFLSTAYIGKSYDELHDFQFVTGDRQLTWHEIKELAANGWSIQSHGNTHVRMTGFDKAGLAGEVTVSKNVIEQNLGKPVTSFAFPYGLYNGMVIEQLKLAGYQFAYTVHSGKLFPAANKMRLPRIEVNNMDTMDSFITKARTGYISPENARRSKVRDLIYANTAVKDFLERWTPMLGIGNR